MALEGKLSDFNLAEILQLISNQQKSGYLKLVAARNMVFIFDKGKLVGTRDRRNDARDPLESFLKAYGFFNIEQWKHVEFVSRNSTLDLTEILVSENLLTEEKLSSVLQSLAQEMTTSGMKLRKGSYHFKATKGSPPGVRRLFSIDIQGLLMEAARRLDEEKLLIEALPSPSICFIQGDKVIPQEALSQTGQFIMSLALAGLPLGRIIRQGRAESFVVRNLLKTWCHEGFLQVDDSAETSVDRSAEDTRKIKIQLGLGLRRAPLVFLAVLLLLGFGWLRWTTPPIADMTVADSVRANQLRSEVRKAATLFRYRQGQWPESLEVLVNNGTLSLSTMKTLDQLDWHYNLDQAKDRFVLQQS